MPRSPTPVGQPFLAITRKTGVAFRILHTVGPTIMPYEAQSRSLHACCLRFTAWVTPTLRKTRFPSAGSALTGQDFHLLGSILEFPVGYQNLLFQRARLAWRTQNSIRRTQALTTAPAHSGRVAW